MNQSFWDLSFPERRLWLDSHIHVNPVMTRKNVQNQYKRSHLLYYSLLLLMLKESVCKVMFQNTGTKNKWDDYGVRET